MLSDTPPFLPHLAFLHDLFLLLTFLPTSTPYFILHSSIPFSSFPYYKSSVLPHLAFLHVLFNPHFRPLTNFHSILNLRVCRAFSCQSTIFSLSFCTAFFSMPSDRLPFLRHLAPLPGLFLLFAHPTSHASTHDLAGRQHRHLLQHQRSSSHGQPPATGG